MEILFLLWPISVYVTAQHNTRRKCSLAGGLAINVKPTSWCSRTSDTGEERNRPGFACSRHHEEVISRIPCQWPQQIIII
uniref:Putative secreted protein n=1 Tax=Anopheles marajoara TaxID=58244 RepID=A0A2M4CBM5_9DIPT